MAEKISVLIVEDHAATRLAIRRLLETDPRFSVAGVSKEAATVIDQVEACHPNVLLVDFRLPDETGKNVTESVLEKNPGAIIVGMSSDEANGDAFLHSGATEFFHKLHGFSVLADTLVRAAG